MNEIRFRRDTAFRKQFFVPDSFAHPAKMDAQLLIWIAEKYTEVGETILDPMAGSGTTMLACTLGRDVVLIELEKKFCKMIADNWKEVRMRPQLGSEMGRCQIIQGDARQIEGLLVDKIVSSPPYSDMSMGGGLNTKPPRDGHDDQAGRSMSPSQAGAGKYDKIITSPPFASNTYGGESQWLKEHQDEISRNSPSRKGAHQNINLHHDGLIIPDSKVNIGNLPYGEIDKIITSPPYEEAHDRKIGGLTDKDRPDLIPYAWVKSDNEANIGNLKSQSYLQAMALVYQQCFKVLKDGGLMVLVTKNFIRNKQVIRLDTDTIKLCEQAGFRFIERHYRKLPAQSFWRIIYYKKHPEVERLDYEDVLCFKK